MQDCGDDARGKTKIKNFVGKDKLIFGLVGVNIKFYILSVEILLNFVQGGRAYKYK